MNIKKKLQAIKCEGYLLEPLFDKYLSRWQSHHVTNPTAFRPSFDDRVYLGYRAGGDRDHYCINDIDVWSSSLGLAILDEEGMQVQYRLPYPIMKIAREYPLPQSKDEFDNYPKEYMDKISVLHDFRLYEHEGYLFVIYHDGKLQKAYDCVKRMKIKNFKARVDKSLELMLNPIADIEHEWNQIWWNDNVWENAGIDDTRLIYPTDTNKNDIIFFRLGNGKIQMHHRPLPDMAVFDTNGLLKSRSTVDGFSEMGVLETCARPGMFDNSHIGSNGMPTRAKIGDVDVYIDVCHGVHNKTLTKECEFSFGMIYLPYFRVRDYHTGELLYYSENPILEVDEVWEEYEQNGRWIKLLDHHAILFTGGQIEKTKGKNSLDDEFVFYAGAGDTAIVKGTFTIRELLPNDVINDIIN